MARKIITVLADFGNGPYAWIKDSRDKTSRVGACIADAVTGFPKSFKVSKALEKDFSDWIVYFENHHEDKKFNWAKFNSRGVELSRRLKAEVGGRYDVRYTKPYEDPDHGIDETIVIP